MAVIPFLQAIILNMYTLCLLSMALLPKKFEQSSSKLTTFNLFFHQYTCKYRLKDLEEVVTVITGVLPAPVYNPHPPKWEEYVFKFGV